MAETRAVSIVGKKKSGKTSVLVALSAEYQRRGRRVMTLKHGSHPVQLDTPGTDTYRHATEGRAERVLIESPGHRAVFERTESEADPEDLIRRYLSEADIVLVEGFTSHDFPKIEVYRTAVHREAILDPKSPAAKHWIAVLTDNDEFEAPCPVFRFSDTMWFVALSQLAWTEAKAITV